MKGVAALALLAVLGFLAAEAPADSVPVPTVPTVTATVPTLPVTLPTVMQLPAPTSTSTTIAGAGVGVSTPSLPSGSSGTNSGSGSSGGGTSSGATGSGTSGGGSSGGGSSSGGSASSDGGNSSSSGSASGTSGSSSSAAQGAGIKHLQSSRSWIATTGPTGRRAITLTFVLRRAARVVFVVRQVAPVCRFVARFTVKGHAGVNRVRLGGRVHGTQLTPGTYKVGAHTGRSVQRVTLVVVDDPAPTKAEIAAAHTADVCATTRAFASSQTPSSAAAVSGSGSLSAADQLHLAGAPAANAPDPHQAGVLSSTVQKAAEAVRPALVALLALAIVFLGLASLPKTALADPRLNELLAKHRFEFAALGAAALVAAALAFLLG